MRNILNIIIICCLATVSTFAQMTSSRSSFGQSDYDEMTSSRAVMNSPRYSSPIYEPFSNTLPSEQTEMTSSGVNKGGPRKSKEGNTDPGITDDNSSPIGDALFPLLALSLVFGGITLFRKRRDNVIMK